MGRTNVLTGSQIARFKDIELHGNLRVITDSRGPRRVVHEYPYRDGAKVETLGRRPHHTEWQLTFTGENWLADFLKLANSIDADPSGLLVHPIYGQMQVVCEGFDRATVDIVNATDTIDLTLTFVEDQLDLGIQAQVTVAQLQQNVADAADDLRIKTQDYSSAVQPAEDLASGAVMYAALAFESALSGLVDPSLGPQLDTVIAATAAASDAILLDPEFADSTFTYDALAAAEVVMSACLDLRDAVALETQGFQKHVVQGDASLAVILMGVFGPLAISKYDQALRLNPQILDPTNIPASTVLVLPL